MVGKNIQKFRELKKMTQEELAAGLNVTRQAVSNWETGKTQPDIETLQKIAQLLDVSVEEIIYGEKRTHTTNIQNIVNNSTVRTVTKGLSFGSALAMVISFVTWQSIGWAILHGLFSWVYVIYFIIKYGWS